MITDKKDKINDFLERIDLSDRIVSNPHNNICVLEETISYDTINCKLNQLKNQSVNYLSSMLNKIQL